MVGASFDGGPPGAVNNSQYLHNGYSNGSSASNLPAHNQVGVAQDGQQLDVNTRRPSASQQRICGKCGKPLTGQFVRALSDTFHLECFTCHVSSAPLPLHSPLVREASAVAHKCRTATRLSPRNSSLFPITRRTSIHCAKSTTFAVWICCASHATVRYEALTSQPWTANTTSSTSPAVYVRLCSARRTRIMSMKGASSVTITTRRDSHKNATAARLPSSSSLSKSFATEQINTGTRNAT